VSSFHLSQMANHHFPKVSSPRLELDKTERRKSILCLIKETIKNYKTMRSEQRATN